MPVAPPKFLRPSEDGEYDSYFTPAGVLCRHWRSTDDWLIEVCGHHGEKQENTRPFKWRGLGNYSGHTTLYSLAKKQNPNWTSVLPSELRFGAAVLPQGIASSTLGQTLIPF